jgi:hypothetical protein
MQPMEVKRIELLRKHLGFSKEDTIKALIRKGLEHQNELTQGG